MSSYRQTVWAYKPLSTRRREEGPVRERASGSVEAGTGRSSRRPVQIQRSASLVHHQQDLLSSQIRDFLQRTDPSARRSKSRSMDIQYSNEQRTVRSGTLSPNAYFKPRDVSISSREDSILEEREEVKDIGSELDEPCSSLSSERSDMGFNRPLLKDNISQKYMTMNKHLFGNDSDSRSSVFSVRSIDSKVGVEDRNGYETVPRYSYENLKKQFHSNKMKISHQHQIETDNLQSLKKQLERKLYETYESVDEQKQIANQWKKKFSNLSTEFSELKLQLDDQLSQKCLMEKKRRKEESDFQYFMDELNQEKKRSDKLAKEKEAICQEKSQLEETVNELRCELQMKTSQIKSLNETITINQNNMYDLELENWKKSHSKLKKKCLQLEEELENNARQIDSLEDAKHKMEQNVEKLKKEQKQEIAQREEEVEEVRYNLEKKMKTLHCQLEKEIHDKTILLKEKLKLQRQIDDLQDSVSHSQNTATSLLDKMKNKLIKTKALLKDEKKYKDQNTTKETNKVLLRKLKNQLDGVELEKLTAIKTKQKYEMEFVDLVNNITELERSKTDTERKYEDALKEVKDQQKLLDDKEEEISGVMARFTTTTQQITENQGIIEDMTNKICNLEHQNASFIEKIASLHIQIENTESLASSSSKLQAENYKAKIKELESKHELDKAMMSRRELQLSQMTSQLEKALSENDKAQCMLNDTAREVKSYTRRIKDLQEETKKLSLRESELLTRNKDLAMKVEAVETEKGMIFAELKMANERITTLREAMDETGSCLSDSSTESVDGTTNSLVTLEDFKYNWDSSEAESALSENEIHKENGKLY